MQRQTGENKESDLLAPPKPDRIKPSGPSLFQTPVNPGFCIWASTPEFVCQNLPQASPACTARADLKPQVICLQFLRAVLAAGMLMFPPNTEHPWLFLGCYPRQVGWQESNPAVPGFSSISTFPDYNKNTLSGLSKCFGMFQVERDL